MVPWVAIGCLKYRKRGRRENQAVAGADRAMPVALFPLREVSLAFTGCDACCSTASTPVLAMDYCDETSGTRYRSGVAKRLLSRELGGCGGHVRIDRLVNEGFCRCQLAYVQHM